MRKQFIGMPLKNIAYCSMQNIDNIIFYVSGVRDIRVAEEEAIVEEEEEVHNREDSSSRDLSPVTLHGSWREMT